MRLRQTGYCARLVSVPLRTNEFFSCSPQRKIASAIDCTNAIHEIACQLFDELWKGEPVRHLGVRVCQNILCSCLYLKRIMKNKEPWIERLIYFEVDLDRMPFPVHRFSIVG